MTISKHQLLVEWRCLLAVHLDENWDCAVLDGADRCRRWNST